MLTLELEHLFSQVFFRMYVVGFYGRGWRGRQDQEPEYVRLGRLGLKNLDLSMVGSHWRDFSRRMS